MDGILGLGFQSISQTGSKNFVQIAKDQGKIPAAIFSFALKKQSSELYIGGHNSNKYNGEFTCTPTTKQTYWLVKGAAEPKGATLPTEKYDGNMIIDSGTTILVGDNVNVPKFYAGIPGAFPCTDLSECGVASGFWTVPCDKIPDVDVTFANRKFTIPANSFSCKPRSVICFGLRLMDRICSGIPIGRQHKVCHLTRIFPCRRPNWSLDHGRHPHEEHLHKV